MTSAELREIRQRSARCAAQLEAPPKVVDELLEQDLPDLCEALERAWAEAESLRSQLRRLTEPPKLLTCMLCTEPMIPADFLDVDSHAIAYQHPELPGIVVCRACYHRGVPRD